MSQIPDRSELVTIHAYASRGITTADARYHGVFVLLYVTAIVLGLWLFAAGIGTLMQARSAAAGISVQNPEATILLAVLSLVPAILYFLAGVLGICRLRADYLLLLASFVLIILGVAMSVVEILSLNYDRDSWVDVLWFPYLFEAAHLMLWAAFPILCIAGVSSLRQERFTGINARSPWMPLARAIAGIAIALGTTLAYNDARILIENRRYATDESAQGMNTTPALGFEHETPAEKKQAWWDSLGEAVITVGVILGGVMTLRSRLVGRLIVVTAGAALLGSCIEILQRNGVFQYPMSDIAGEIVFPARLAFFLILAAIVLLRPGLSTPRNPMPASL